MSIKIFTHRLEVSSKIHTGVFNKVQILACIKAFAIVYNVEVYIVENISACMRTPRTSVAVNFVTYIYIHTNCGISKICTKVLKDYKFVCMYYSIFYSQYHYSTYYTTY